MKVIPYNFNEIPAELRNMPNWILWKAEQKDNGKITKIPYQIDGNEARSNDARTWSTFPTAAKFYKDSNADGIGFVFSRRDNFVGIDIDKCVTYASDDEKHENPIVSDFAKDVIEMLDSYTEFSVSGTGVHIIVRGSLPQSICGTGRKNAKLGLEIYQHGRYFTMTGNRENSNEIFDRTDELVELLEKYFDDSDLRGRVVNISEYENDEIKLSNEQLWQKMFNSRNGDEIRALYNGHLIDDDHSSSDMALANHLAFWTGKSATRMDSMFRETSLMRDKWDRITYSDTGEAYGERTIAKAIASTTTTILDHKNDSEFSFAIHSDDVVEEVEQKPARKFKLTDLGNAERIAYEYGHIIRYIPSVGWYVWNGKYWEFDDKGKLHRLVAKVVRKLGESEDEIEKKWARHCEKHNVRESAIKDLKILVPGDRSEFDMNKFLFNVSNGIVDLQTGQLQPHDREKRLTKMANVEFVEGAKCPTWLAFLDQIFLGDKDLAEYMQRLIGYSLTGDISEQIMMFLVGGGSNGKSTFINTIKDLVGEYGKQAKADTFIKKKDTGANNDIARLVGSRFVSAIESEEGEKLSESFVKQITGGEPVLARFLRQEYFEYIPEFKVFFTTNHKPIIGGLDEGIWRRVKLIPFDLNLPAHQRDKKLPEKLSLEMPGILNWAIEGCLKWQKDGLKEPAIVTKATGLYKADMDILDPFLIECCYQDKDNDQIKIEAKELYNVYDSFCYKSGERTLGNRSFYRMLETKGYKKERGAGNKLYVYGITLLERAPKGVTQQHENVTEEAEKVGFKLV
ncbi:phage/plasmid primase, P4 family [Lysinibacillus fusiformis]|uniref:phage/plasmid primase, P4 family n=1 Tax=Lysinibacillus fusiformis TaxID=28031 RepID=UPI000887CB60|nr:phage/plasmid primase, P4 family [Lysinibacillus fusiformis]SCX38384.1 putative DNA primase/helicase [Lysinibacillus fusiformis]SDB05388.1 putative DNA primase/helicase [Lysinibacillus fusiformis]SFH75168.1 putative DNA primase/helicase [Lysinibacillus fusiformis]SFT29745.1 putative DNA primase/helicase [Lysinibacillus fusiformis]